MHVVLVVQQGENYEKRRNSDEYSRGTNSIRERERDFVFDKWDQNAGRKEGCVQVARPGV